MEIIRVLNTNAVVTLDGDRREVIVTGPGIGFQKKKSQILDDSRIDKTYRLESREDSRRFQDIVQAVSGEYLGIAGKVVDAARNEQDLKIKDILYVALTDHISSAMERHGSGIDLKNMMKIDIRKFYPREYAVGKRQSRGFQRRQAQTWGRMKPRSSPCTLWPRSWMTAPWPMSRRSRS